ncbi:MAG: hypothetical protein R3D53_00500 [Paracoccaceae bacterium]
MRAFFRLLFGFTLTAAVLVMGARWLFPLPDISSRPAELALPARADTRLGQLMVAGQGAHPDLSGVVPLADGHDALASRLAIVETAQVSLDVQYYIWHDDTLGHSAARCARPCREAWGSRTAVTGR